MVNKLLMNFRSVSCNDNCIQFTAHDCEPPRLQFLVPVSSLCAPIPPRSCLPRTLKVNVSPLGMSGALPRSRGHRGDDVVAGRGVPLTKETLSQTLGRPGLRPEDQAAWGHGINTSAEFAESSGVCGAAEKS